MGEASTSLVERLRAALAAHAPADVVAAYLYGSRARSTSPTDSDVDVAYFRRTPSAPTFLAQPYALAGRLEEALDLQVDLVELNQAPPDLVHEVLRDGVIVLDREPELRVQMEVRARARYLDMLPVLRQYRRTPARHDQP